MWARRVSLGCAMVLCVLLPAQKLDVTKAPVSLDGPSRPVPAEYFGMHVHRLRTTTPWPTVRFKSMRLWDTETTWAELEPNRGEWRFEKLDRLASMAEQHHVNLLLCFGRTPDWAAAQTAMGLPAGKPEAAPPANMEDWKTFVRAVVTRYKGRIEAYEIWNEPNLSQYYTGDIATMVTMTREAAKIIHSIDPAAKVVSPSATTQDGLAWLGAFLDAGGAQYVDVIGYHFYVTPDSPEKIVPLAGHVMEEISRHGAKMPVWDTETGWAQPKIFSSKGEPGAYVARALLLGWASGIDRFYWYAWDNRNWVTLNLTDGDDYRGNENARAYDAVESWMLGKRIEGCSTNKDQTWVCKIADNGGKKSIIFWNPSGIAPLPLHPAENRFLRWHIETLDGTSTTEDADGVEAGVQPRRLYADSAN